MFKNLFVVCVGSVLLGAFSAADAQTIEVKALEHFSTSNPPKTMEIELSDSLNLQDDGILVPGTIINGKISNVKAPKRLKRDAKFTFKPSTYKTPEGESKIIKSDVKATYTKNANADRIIQSAVLSVGNHFFKGLKMGVSAIQGAVKNEKGNRPAEDPDSGGYRAPGDDRGIYPDQLPYLPAV